MQKKMLVNTIQSDMAPCNCFRNAFHFVEGPSLSQSEFVPIGLGMLFAINYLFNEQQTMQARDLTVIGTEKKTMARIQKQGFWGGNSLTNLCETQKPFHVFICNLIFLISSIDRLYRCTAVKVWLQVLHREWFVAVWMVGVQKSIVFEQEEQNSAGVRPARLLWFMPRALQLRDSALVKLPQFSRFVDSRHLDKRSQVVLNLRPGRVGHTFHRLGYNSRSKTTTIKLSLATEAAFSLSYKSTRMTMDLNPSTAFLCMYYICFFVWYSTKVWGCFFLQLGVLFVSPADPTSNHQTFAFKAIGQGADFWCLAWFWCKRLIFQGAHGCKPFWSFLHIVVWYIHQYESVLQDVSLYCVLKILDWSKQFPLLRSSELLFCWKLAFPFSFHGNLAFPSNVLGRMWYVCKLFFAVVALGP